MLTRVFMNQIQPITNNIDKMAKKSLQATFKQMYAVFCNLYWLIYEQSHLYNQNKSLFCMSTAPKSLQKTPVWIIMRTLLNTCRNSQIQLVDHVT